MVELISGVIGLGLGIVGTWLTYRNRISPQREILYTKQSEIYSKTLVEFQSLYNSTLWYLNASESERREIQDDILQQWQECSIETSDIGGISPTGVYLAYGDLIALIMGVINPAHDNYNKIEQVDLVKAYYQFINSIRRSMGVDSLTEESMGLYKKPTDTRDYLTNEFYDSNLNHPDKSNPD